MRKRAPKKADERVDDLIAESKRLREQMRNQVVSLHKFSVRLQEQVDDMESREGEDHEPGGH